MDQRSETGRTSPQGDKELQDVDESSDTNKIQPRFESESEEEFEEEDKGSIWIDEESPVAESTDDETVAGETTQEGEADVLESRSGNTDNINVNRSDESAEEVLESPGEDIAEQETLDEPVSRFDAVISSSCHSPRETEKVVTTRNGLNVRIYVADIAKVKADAVVTSDNPYSNDKSMVSRALCAIPGGQEFREKRRRRRSTQGVLELGRVYSLPVKNKEFPFKYVLQAIITGYDSKISPTKWRRLLTALYKNIYKKADEKDVTSVAVPLLGTGRGEGSTDMSVEVAARTVCAYRPVSLEEVHFVSLDRDVSDYLAVICESCIDISEEPGQDSAEEEEEEETRPGNVQGLIDPLAGAAAALLSRNQHLSQLFSQMFEPKQTQRTEDATGFSPGREQDLINNHEESADEGNMSSGVPFSNRKRDPDDHEEETEEGPLFETVIDEDLVQTGNQPPGTMSLATLEDTHLPGHEGDGTIVITYQIPSGSQTAEHPHPGKRYHGVHRTAFLPDNEQGNMVTRMLKEAFERRLVFTVGRSQTTGEGDVVRWGPISHKTSQTGGPDRYGYPDSTYLDTVTSELLELGITDVALGGEEE